jgi:hypothetical protein
MKKPSNNPAYVTVAGWFLFKAPGRKGAVSEDRALPILQQHQNPPFLFPF